MTSRLINRPHRLRALPAALLVLLAQGAIASPSSAIAPPDSGSELDRWLQRFVGLHEPVPARASSLQPRDTSDYVAVNGDGSHFATAAGVRSLAAGYGAYAGGEDSAAFGRDAYANGYESLAVGGRNVSAIGDSSVAIGNNVINNAVFTVALGAGQRGAALEVDAASSGGFVVASDGHGGLLNSAQAVAILGSAVNAAQGVAVGVDAVASAARAIALGAGASATTADGVALGAGSMADRGNAVSIGSAGIKRQLINLAAGTVDSDAGTLGQLRASLDSFGGGAGIDGNGVVVAPNYLVQGMSERTVGGALGVLDTGISTNASGIGTNASSILALRGRVGTNEVAIGALNDDVVRIDGTLARAAFYDDTAKAAISFQGAAGTQLKNVADGTADMDAVNLRQLRASGLVGPGGDPIAAVTYNDDKSIVLLAGSGGSLLTGLRDGVVDASSTDGVNGRQLFAFGQRVEANERGIATLNDDVDTINDTLTRATFYDDVTKGAITFGGLAGTQLKNVADGTDDTDAVNLRQLRAAGLVGPGGEVIGAVTYNADKSVVALAGIGGTLITNLRPGAIAPGSTDAINGGQAWAIKDELDQRIDIVENQINNIEQNIVTIGDVINQIIEGDLGFSVDGTGIDSTQVGKGAVASGDYSTATGVSAIAAGERSTAIGQGAHATATGSTAIGEGAQAVGQNAVALGSGSVADRDNTVSIGSVGSERQLTNVAAGVLDTDGVNMGQLKDARDWAARYMDEKASMLERRIDKVDRRAAAGSASAIAMANMPQPFAAGQNAVSAGLGTFNGQSALSVGVSAISASGRWQYRMSAAKGSDGSTGAGFGLARVW